jgi:hypothetical protein
MLMFSYCMRSINLVEIPVQPRKHLADQVGALFGNKFSAKNPPSRNIAVWKQSSTAVKDAAFITEVPELAADGATRQKALANVKIVIAEWLERSA